MSKEHDESLWIPVTKSPRITITNAFNPNQPRASDGRWGSGGSGGIQSGKSPGGSMHDTEDDDHSTFQEFQEYKKFKALKKGGAGSGAAGSAAKGGSEPGDPEKTIPDDGADGGGKGKGASSIDGTKAGAPDLDEATKKKADGALTKMYEFLKSTAANTLPVAGTVAKTAAKLAWEGVKGAYNRYGNFGSIGTGLVMGTGMAMAGVPAATVAVGVVGAMETRKLIRGLMSAIDGPVGGAKEDSLIGGFIKSPMISTRDRATEDEDDFAAYRRRRYSTNAVDENAKDVSGPMDPEESDAEQMAQAGPLEVPEGLAEYILQFIESYCAELKVQSPNLSLEDVKEMLATLANYLTSEEEPESKDGAVPPGDDEEPTMEGDEEAPVEEEVDAEEPVVPAAKEKPNFPLKKPVGNFYAAETLGWKSV